MFEGHTELVAATYSAKINILTLTNCSECCLVNQNILDLAQYTECKLTPPPILQGNGLNHLDSRQALSLRTFRFFGRQHWILFTMPSFC